MKRTTVSLPDDVALAAEREARRRSTSVSEVTRQALAEHLGLGQGPRALAFANLGRSGRRDTSSRIEEEMLREWHL